MKDVLIARAVYNKNSDLKLIEFVRGLDASELKRPRGGCIAGQVQDDISVFDLVGHMALAGIFLYQILKEKGIAASYDQALLNIGIRSMRPDPQASLDSLMKMLLDFDDGLIEFAKTVDLNSFDYSDFAPYDPGRGAGMLGYTAATWLEHTFSHQIHHRGQISQILSELGIGYDLSQFRIYAFGAE